MTEKETFDPVNLYEQLPIYYRRLFPCGLFYRWLNYGDPKGNNFKFREFSFTLADDIYVRHLSFSDKDEMEQELLRQIPHKIDIGAVLNGRAKDHRCTALKPVHKELVLDIDLTDYDNIRKCCQGGDVCTKCWKFMVVAVKVLDAALRDDFGYHHLLWVFSGRRGIHCWISDTSARLLNGISRSALVEYLSPFPSEKPVLTSIEKYHPSLRRAYRICLPYFQKVCLEDQDIFAGEKGLKKLLSYIDDSEFSAVLKNLLNKAGSGASSATRWDIVTAAVKERRNKVGRGFINKFLFEEEVVLRYLMPRLDANVTTGMGHLLKAPFCVHPKTGCLAMPINPKQVDKFDPNASSPTITRLLMEIDEYDARSAEVASTTEIKRVRDSRKTSMHRSIVIFEEFLKGIENERKEDRLLLNDMKMEF